MDEVAGKVDDYEYVIEKAIFWIGGMDWEKIAVCESFAQAGLVLQFLSMDKRYEYRSRYAKKEKSDG